MCSLSRSGRITTRASCSGSEGFEIRPGESLRPHSSSLKRHCWWWQRVNLCHRPVHSPLSINISPRNSDHFVDGFFVPPVLLFHSPDLARSEYTFCRPHKALDTVVSHSQPYLGFILFNGCEDIGLASTFSPKWHKFLCRLLATKCSSHVPPTRAR